MGGDSRRLAGEGGGPLGRPARTSRNRTESLIRQELSRGRIRKTALASLAVLAAAGTVTGAVLYNPFGGEQTVGGKVSGTVPVESQAPDGGRVAISGSEEQFAVDDPNPYSQKDWQDKTYSAQAVDGAPGEALTEELDKAASDSGVLSASGLLPSETAGFTGDLGQANLPDGSQNPMFSYWTQERFARELTSHTERLLNPAFGGWGLYQLPEYHASSDFNLALVSDMFTSRWAEANAGKPYSEYVPVFADWGSDDYGGSSELLGVARWFGKLESSGVVFTYDENTNQYSAAFEGKVRFTAWTKDQTKIEKTGTLVLDLVPATVQDQPGNVNRVLIDSATLKVD